MNCPTTTTWEILAQVGVFFCGLIAVFIGTFFLVRYALRRWP